MKSQTWKAGCEGVQMSHGKVEVLSNSYLFRDSIQPGKTTADWGQAKSKDPIISQVLEAIHNKAI